MRIHFESLLAFGLFIMESIEAFPFMTALEFELACEAINSRFDLCGHLQNDWSRVKVIKQDAVHLSITKMLHVTIGEGHLEDVAAEDEVEEDDEEALQAPSNGARGLRIEYQIFLSPSYQVPVLYLVLEGRGDVVPSTIESLYDQVVPERFKSQVRSFGIIGGITMTVRNWIFVIMLL